jgi:integrase
MRFLHAKRYLETNPFAEANILVNRSSESSTVERRRKAVLQDEWAAAWSYLESQPMSARLQRVRVILLLLKETGCRLQQLASMRRDALLWDGKHWCLKVNANDRPNRTIIVSTELRDALFRIYRCHGFPELDRVPLSTPLITTLPMDLGSAVGVHALTGARIYQIVKDYFVKVANAISPCNTDLSARLRKITADSFLYRG